ncbi:hypothetical protein POUND7_003972 [Theobroma cacao]
MCYGFRDEIFFHYSCLNNMPNVLKHPFHPSHHLHLRSSYLGIRLCKACNKLMKEWEKSYFCPKCTFHLHVLCARLQPSLKVELDEHDLTYFQITSYDTTFLCKKCNSNCGAGYKESVFYRCVQCNFNYHFSCLGILSSTTHKYHRHDLMLIDSFIEDDSKEYYFDICEEERKPKHYVYCCKECEFVAHIECALNKVVDIKLAHGLLDNKEEIEQRNPKVPTHLSIENFDHPHPLSYYEAIERNENPIPLCDACYLEISGQAYACKNCKYYLHETCATLPYEVLHILHPQHPLQFLTFANTFTCYECKGHSYGFSYKCYKCEFTLDVKCATTPIAPKNEGQGLIEMERFSKLCLFNQNHKLEFFNVRSKSLDLKCDACRKQIVGPAYRCGSLFCNYQLHESCLALVQEMQHPFHPLHPLHPQVFRSQYCSACKQQMNAISYSCQQCDLHLHFDCASSLKLALKLKFHQHSLYYFGPHTVHSFGLCDRCKNHVSGAPLYHCMECGISLHFGCVQMPHSIKSKCHIHPLTLKDSFVEDDSEEYYCNICEEERNSENHVYCCEECDGQFVAHIECMLPTKYWVDKKLNKYFFMLFARDLLISWVEDQRYWHWSYQKETNSDVLIDVAELLAVCWLEMRVKFNVKKLSPKTLYGVVFVFKLTNEAYGWDIPVNFGFTLPNGYKVELKETLMTKPKGVWIEIPVGEFTTSSEIVGELDIYCHQYDVLTWKGGLIIKGVSILPKN